jgi:hypothetical protein
MHCSILILAHSYARPHPHRARIRNSSGTSAKGVW